MIRQKLVVDCGSYKTAISDKDRCIRLNETSLMYLVHENAIAIADKYRLFWGKGEPYSPIMGYEIGGKYYTKKMLSYFLQMAAGKAYFFFRPKLEVLFTLPFGDEADSMKQIADALFLDDVSFIEQPLAAAIGIGLDIFSKNGKMIVDIGHKTTDIAVISNGQIVYSSSIPIAGKQFNDDIQHYLNEDCNIWVGEITAEAIKFKVGAAIHDLSPEDIPVDSTVRIPNNTRTKWIETPFSYDQIASFLDLSLVKVETEIQSVLENLPSDLLDDITRDGIWLVGGSSRLRGIGKRFSRILGINCRVSDDPELVTVLGAAKSLGEMTR